MGAKLPSQPLERIDAASPHEHFIALALQDAAKIARICCWERKRKVVLCQGIYTLR